MAKREQIKKALLQAERKYRHIFENATEGIFEAGIDGRFISVNPALARLHGYDSPAQLITAIGSIRSDIFADPDRHRELIRRLLAEDAVSNFEARMRRKDGSEHWVSTNARAFRNSGGRIVFYEGTMTDITTRKEAEQALAESEELYRTVIEHSNDGISIARGGVYVYVNPRFVEMFGYDGPDKIVNKPVAAVVHPDDRERVMEIHRRRWTGEPVPARYEYKGITASGTSIYVEVSAAVITYLHAPAILIFLRDVTERKRAEEFLLHSHRELEQLNRAKTKAVNHISHELKTPLAVIQGNIRILRRKLQVLAPDDSFDGMVEAIGRNLERLYRMQKEADEILRTTRQLEAGSILDEIDQLKERMTDFGEIPKEIDAYRESVRKWIGSHMPRGADAFQPLDLYPFLMQSKDRARHHSAHRNIDVVVEDVHDASILMDPSILRDVIDGLIRNAIENTPDGGLVTISTEERGDNILVHVTDSGVGISEENQQYIFDGLFYAQKTDLYASKQPYDFNAGGKGLDLLRMKAYAERFGFSVSVKSTRCRYLTGDTDECPGNVAACPHLQSADECRHSNRTTFTVSFMKSPEVSRAIALP